MSRPRPPTGNDPSEPLGSDLCRLAVTSGLISPSEGFLTAAGIPVSPTVNVVLIHDNSHDVTRSLQSLFGTVEAYARQVTEASIQVDRYWLNTKLIRGGADLVNREVYNDTRQAEILNDMVPFSALKSPCFYLRGVSNMKAVLQAFAESFDRKVFFNLAGSDLLPSLTDGRQEGPALRLVSLLAGVLRGDSIMLPAGRDKEEPRLIHGKAAAFFDLSRETLERLLARGRPEVLRLLQQCVLVDFPSPPTMDGLKTSPPNTDDWPTTVESVINRRIRGTRLPLIELDFRLWEEHVGTIAARNSDIADWLGPYFDLPAKLAAIHQLARWSSSKPSSEIVHWVIDFSNRLMTKQIALLRAVANNRLQASDEAKEAAILQRLESPKKFRDLARSFSDQRKEAIWPSLARLMSKGRVVQVNDDCFVAVTRGEPAEAARPPSSPAPHANLEARQGDSGRA